MKGNWINRFAPRVAALGLCILAGQGQASAPAFDAALLERIDAFVESERQASGIPGIALAIVHAGGAPHVRGFGQDGRGKAIGADTPFPIGSLTKFVLLGAVLQAVTGRSWQELIQVQVLQPLQMTHSHTDHHAARQAGMTTLHRMWFGLPVAQQTSLLPGFGPTGSLVASAGDMARYLQMLLAAGMAPAGRVLSAEGVAQLLAPASPPGRSKLLSADFEFRYGEGWFVGPFGAASDARWHLGNLASFAAWMVLLPDTQQAVVMLINANSELPLNEVNAVMSRLPIGVVNLLRGQPVPQGPSLRSAYLPINAASAFVLIVLAVSAWWAARTRRAVGSVVLLLTAIVLLVTLQVMGLSAKLLSAFAPDFALVLAVATALLCAPAAWRAGAWARRSLGRKRGVRQP
jgi:CubicO group peptidase (beta-lactamase class C family)